MTPQIAHKESDFEAFIVSEMTADGSWIGGDPRGDDAYLGLYVEDVIAFVKATQPKKWERLTGLAGGEPQAATGPVKARGRPARQARGRPGAAGWDLRARGEPEPLPVEAGAFDRPRHRGTL